jgi:hypothetical protein
MQISACMPLARCFRALRFLGAFRGWDRILRLFFHPDRQNKAPLNFDFEGIRYPGSTGYLVDWSAFFNGAYEKPWLEYCLSHLDNPLTRPFWISAAISVTTRFGSRPMAAL